MDLLYSIIFISVAAFGTKMYELSQNATLREKILRQFNRLISLSRSYRTFQIETEYIEIKEYHSIDEDRASLSFHKEGEYSQIVIFQESLLISSSQTTGFKLENIRA